MRGLTRCLRLLTALLVLVSASWAQPVEEGAVLAVRPEGVVVDVGRLPDLQPGSKVGFVRREGGRRETGQGWVLDVREGRALVGAAPGGAVNEGDLVVLCPRPGEEDPYGELRTAVDDLQKLPGGPGARVQRELQETTGQLQSALDARNAAVQRGACDTAQYDQQIWTLAEQLRDVSARLPQPAGQGAIASTPQPAPQGPAQPESTQLEGAQPHVAPAEGPQSGGVQPGGAPPEGAIDTLSRTIDVVAKLAGVVQSLRGQPGVGGGVQGGLEGTAPPASGFVDPGMGSGTPVPPPGPGPQPAGPSTGGSRGGWPGGKTLIQPTPGGPSSPSAGAQWWQTSKGQTLIKTAPAPGASASSGTATPQVAPPPSTSTTVGGSQTAPSSRSVVAKPGVIGPLVKATPGEVKPASVTGRVSNDKGQPVPEARVTVAGAGPVRTNLQGRFEIRNLQPGRREVTVAASGFATVTRTVTLQEGKVEDLSFTLRGKVSILPLR